MCPSLEDHMLRPSPGPGPNSGLSDPNRKTWFIEVDQIDWPGCPDTNTVCPCDRITGGDLRNRLGANVDCCGGGVEYGIRRGGRCGGSRWRTLLRGKGPKQKDPHDERSGRYAKQQTPGPPQSGLISLISAVWENHVLATIWSLGSYQFVLSQLRS